MEYPRQTSRLLPATALALAAVFAQPEDAQAADMQSVQQHVAAGMAACLPGREGQLEIGTINVFDVGAPVMCTPHAPSTSGSLDSMLVKEPPAATRQHEAIVAAAIAMRAERLRLADVARVQVSQPLLPPQPMPLGGFVWPALAVVAAGGVAVLARRRRDDLLVGGGLSVQKQDQSLTNQESPDSTLPDDERAKEDAKDSHIFGRKAACVRACERLGDPQKQRLADMQAVFDVYTKNVGKEPSAAELRTYIEKSGFCTTEDEGPHAVLKPQPLTTDGESKGNGMSVSGGKALPSSDVGLRPDTHRAPDEPEIGEGVIRFHPEQQRAMGDTRISDRTAVCERICAHLGDSKQQRFAEISKLFDRYVAEHNGRAPSDNELRVFISNLSRKG